MIRSSVDRHPNGQKAELHVPPDMRGYYEPLLRRLRSRNPGAAGPVRIIGITSSVAGEGVSTVARQLAIVAADLASQRVLLVDAAFESQSRTQRRNEKPGLAEAMFDGIPLLNLIEATDLPNFFRLSAGETPLAMCDWSKFEPAGSDLLNQIKANFELTIFDLPPIQGAGCVAFPLSSLDGVLLVVEAEKHSQPVLQKTRYLLESAGAKVLGAILNKHRRYGPRWLYD